MKTAEEIIAQIVQEINQEKIRSVLPNQLTKRSGEYRIGLSKAIDIIESFCLEHPPAAPVSREELLQAEINKCNEALTQPNFSIDSYRCYWEGRKTLAEELLSATLPTREQGAKGCQCKQDYKSVMIAGYTYCQNCGKRR